MKPVKNLSNFRQMMFAAYPVILLVPVSLVVPMVLVWMILVMPPTMELIRRLLPPSRRSVPLLVMVGFPAPLHCPSILRPIAKFSLTSVVFWI
jgi:hypothetical protein